MAGFNKKEDLEDYLQKQKGQKRGPHHPRHLSLGSQVTHRLVPPCLPFASPALYFDGLLNMRIHLEDSVLQDFINCSRNCSYLINLEWHDCELEPLRIEALITPLIICITDCSCKELASSIIIKATSPPCYVLFACALKGMRGTQWELISRLPKLIDSFVDTTQKLEEPGQLSKPDHFQGGDAFAVLQVTQ